MFHADTAGRFPDSTANNLQTLPLLVVEARPTCVLGAGGAATGGPRHRGPEVSVVVVVALPIVVVATTGEDADA